MKMKQGKKASMTPIEKKMFIMGFDQSSLATVTGVSRESIRNILSGKQIPTTKTTKALADALEMDDREFRALLLEMVS